MPHILHLAKKLEGIKACGEDLLPTFFFFKEIVKIQNKFDVVFSPANYCLGGSLRPKREIQRQNQFI